ncbi:type II secretion system F family protein [Rhizorhapis suberifaciens]|uniref:Tight adherence protein B n=1 Tax=Rhizorhapis suberifaciens TaxID=13656 RepID=A0A840HUP8_9SPHN|nr:type II secretion system F family protein [Rhizorhapis suberifaciens]MBB4641216.1 tight adherence protein B [Rhizorhapis suberifaciens]
MNPIFIRFLLLVLIFATVMLAVEGLVSWISHRHGTGQAINKRLKMIASGIDRGVVLSKLRRDLGDDLFLSLGPIGKLGMKIERILHATGLGVPARVVLVGIIGATLIIFFFTILLAGLNGYEMGLGLILMVGAFAFCLGMGLPLMVLSRLAQNRRKKIQDQFPIALDVFVRGLRAGHPIAAALELLTVEMQDPIGSEFGVVVDEVTYGADLRDALQRMADRWGLEDMHMFVVCLSVQSETGGNLAEILENLSQVIRERANLFMKVRALSSEGRMTAIILTALPVMAFTGLFLLNPKFYLDVAGERAFIIGFASLLALYAVGFITIRRMIDLKV